MEEFLTEAIQGQSVPLLFTIALFFAAIVGLGLSIRYRVALVYSYCLLMSLFQAIDPATVVASSTVVLFLILEVFNPDERLVSLYSFKYKACDFVYRIACELYGYVFYALVCVQAVVPESVIDSTSYQLLYLLGVVALAAVVARGKFSTKSVSEILSQLISAGGDPACFEFSDSDKDKLRILVYLEDGQFLDRCEHEHNITVRYVLSRLRRRLGRIATSFTCERAKRLFRGYGTIEMQLLRNVGLEFGSFKLTFRRKVFEWVFAHTLINSYIDQLDRDSFARKNIKYWLLRCYLNVVPVKIGSSVCRPQPDCSTFRHLFGKEFSELTREEFFIWCLGLPHYEKGVGRVAISMHKEAIELFDLNDELIFEALRTATNNSQKSPEELLAGKSAKRRQAECVSAWFEKGPEGGRPQNNSFVWQYVVLGNSSDAPVYNVIVTCVGVQGAGPAFRGEDNGGGYPCRHFVAALPPGQWGIWLPTYGLGMSIVLAAEVAFVDAQGSSWVRRANGALEGIEVDPVVFYGASVPCPWGTCERVVSQS